MPKPKLKAKLKSRPKPRLSLQSNNPFSQFARSIIANSKLHAPLYQLQHESGFNLNILLYLIWYARMGYGRLSRRQVMLLESHIILWHQRVISELKYTHALLTHSEDKIAIEIRRALEIEIERAYYIEQEMLFDSEKKRHVTKQKLEQKLSDACINLLRACELKNNFLIEKDLASFFKILQHAFSDRDSDEIRDQLTRAFSRYTNTSSQLTWETF